MTSGRFSRFAVALLLAAACGKKAAPPVPPAPPAVPPAPAPSVSTIETGKHLDANRRVTSSESVFAPRDTLYLVVVTENVAPGSTLVAKWTFQTGQTVDSTQQAVAPTGGATPAAVTEFHISKPSGWPAGKYRVEVWLNGVSAGSREVEVRK